MTAHPISPRPCSGRLYACLIASLAFAWINVFPVSASIVWSDDFSGEADGAAPTRDFAGGASGEDYTLTNNGATNTIAGAIGGPSPSLQQFDSSTSASSAATATVFMSHFAPFTLSSTTNVLRVRFDFRVDTFSTTSDLQNSRFILRFANSSSNQIVLGFGRGSLSDGDASSTDLGFYARTDTGTTTSIAPTTASAIGLQSGTGWDAGFDFGDYDGTAGNEASNDTNDQFYRFVVSYDFNTGAVDGTVTNVATNESAGFSRSMNAGLAFSNAATTTRGILMSSNNNSQSTSYFDNIVVETVPEPGALASLLGGAGMLLGWNRRRR